MKSQQLRWAGYLGASVIFLTIGLALCDLVRILPWYDESESTSHGLAVLRALLSWLLVLLASGAVMALFNLAAAVRREKQRAADTLRARAAYYQTLVENCASNIVLLDEQGLYTYVGPAGMRLSGYPAEELIGRNPFEYLHPDDLEPCQHLFQQCLQQPGVHFSTEFRLRHKDGTWRWLSSTGVNRLADPNVQGIVVSSHDVTALKEAEVRLLASEQRYRTIAEISAAGIWQVTPDGFTVYANPSMCTLLQLESSAELEGQTFHAYFTGESLIAVAQSHEMRRRGIASMYEVELVGKRGRHSNVLVSGAPLFQIDGRLHCIIATFTDITERKQMEQSLRESEQRYRALFNTTPYPVYVFDVETLSFLAVNAAAIAGYGYSLEEFLALKLLDIRLPEDAPALQANLWQERPPVVKGIVARHRKKDGTQIDVELSTHDLLFAGRRARLVLAVDITDRQRLETQLRQAQKMEAVGRLAGGVAHDFNNVLTVISGFSDLLLRQLGPGHVAHQDLEEIRNAADRATALTRQLLAFSRKNVVAPRVIDLNQVVANLERLLRRLVGEDIVLTTALAAQPAWVKADSGQLEQVIVNLVINARDAMADAGRLTLSVANVELDQTAARAHPALTPGCYVVFKVADTGAGITAEIQAHLFEPFFTTKAQGKGTGLGLFTAYGIVDHHHGHIEVASELGRGTTVSVLLPRALPPLDLPARQPTSDQAPGGSETVLVVEDEPILRALLVRVLKSNGYLVLEAVDGQDALRVNEHHSVSIDLLVTDLVMPKMGGRELAERLGALRPNMKILFMSGYTDGQLGPDGDTAIPVHFLQKPFLPGVLAHKVREMLGTPKK